MDYSEIKKTLDSGSGKQIKGFLIQKTLELRDIENLKEADMIEVKAQLGAYNKLKEIMEQILTWEGQTIKKSDKDGYSLPKKYY